MLFRSYGEFADYDGYMSKFYNKDIFRFSLAEEKEKYALALISEETGLGEEIIKEYFDKGFLPAKTMRQIIFAMDKIEEQFQSIKVKENIRPNSQILKLIVIAKRLGVSNNKINGVVSKHFKDLDRFYIDRLLPLIVQNPRTGVLEQVYIINRQHGDCFIAVTDIRKDGMCNPSIMTTLAVPDGDKEINQRVANMLHLLGY